MAPKEAGAYKLKTPLTKADQLALSSALRTKQQTEYSLLAHQTSEYVDQYVLPHWDNLESSNADRPKPLTNLGSKTAREVVDELGGQLTGLLMTSLEVALQTCKKVPNQPQGPTHFYPRKRKRQSSGKGEKSLASCAC